MIKTGVLATILAVLLQINAFALDFPYLHYGVLVVNPVTYEGTTTYNAVTHNTGGYAREVTSREKHRGKYSYRIDCSSSTGNILVETENLAVRGDMCYNALLLELYVKGFDEKPPSVSFYALFQDAGGAYLSQPPNFKLTCEDAGANEWHRVWGVVPPYNYAKIRFGVSYTHINGAGPDELYIDDITARMIPVRIKVDNAVCGDNSLPLDTLRVTGYNSRGMARPVAAKDLVSYSVVSGSGIIDARQNLVFTGSANGPVVVQADFCGVTTRFTVDFQPNDLVFGEVINENNIYRVSVENIGTKEKSASLLVCVFDADRLVFTRAFRQRVAPGAAALIVSSPVQPPYYVKNPAVRAYVFKGD